jgi:hypothetical protein
LFIAYATEFVDNGNSSSQERNNEEVVLADSALSDWHEHVKIKEATSRCELQRYLEEGFHPCTPDFDILQWWAVNSARYPILGNIARDVLAVPASSVASESAFSTCGRVITDHRTSLGPKTVEALMCYGDWIKHDGNYVFQFSVYPIFIDMYHVAYLDLYLLQDHFPKQAHLMSEQPDLQVIAVPRSQKKVHNIVPFYCHAFARPILCYFHLLLSCHSC